MGNKSQNHVILIESESFLNTIFIAQGLYELHMVLIEKDPSEFLNPLHLPQGLPPDLKAKLNSK